MDKVWADAICVKHNISGIELGEVVEAYMEYATLNGFSKRDPERHAKEWIEAELRSYTLAEMIFAAKNGIQRMKDWEDE